MTAPIGEVDVAPVEVVIIDDHPLFIRGIELVLPRASEGRLAVTGITDDAAQAAGLVRRCRPDIAMVDLSMPAELVGPLLAVMDGWAVLPPVVLARMAGRPAPAASVTVTADQRRLWRWVAAGATTVEIAERPHVSERTAKRMIAALLRRLGVATRAQAAALAGRAGVLDEDG